MKKLLYLTAWIVLGLLLSFIAHALIEMTYINYQLSKGIAPVNHPVFGHAYCALPVWVQVVLPIIGIFGGLWEGFYFWRVIYIEKRNRRNHK